MNILHRSAAHYEDLDLLEITLELLDLDLKDSVPMKMVRFDGIRATANAVVTTADASNVFHLLDDVIIDSQRLARVCRGLGFGRQEVEVASLSQEDLVWLTTDGAGALVLAGDDGGDGYGGGGDGLAGLVDGAEVLAGGVLAGSLDGAEALGGSVDIAEALAGSIDVGGNVLAGVGGGEVLEDGYAYGGGGKVLVGLVDGGKAPAGSVDDAEELVHSVDGGKVLPVLVDGGKALAGLVDGAEVLPGLVDGKEGPLLLADQPLLDDLDVKENVGGDHGHGDGSGQPGAWVQFKEETVVALVRFKIRKLRESIANAKSRVISA